VAGVRQGDGGFWKWAVRGCRSAGGGGNRLAVGGRGTLREYAGMQLTSRTGRVVLQCARRTEPSARKEMRNGCARLCKLNAQTYVIHSLE